jgi:ribosomal protein S18 acetylase RimI-like enzyme
MRHWASKVASGTTGLVACVDDVIVGMALAGSDDSDPSTGYLSRVYVDPDHQGRGIGSALHDASIRSLGERGFGRATLWVLERNARARAWYERLGWQQTADRKPVYPPAGIDDVRYRLTLT